MRCRRFGPAGGGREPRRRRQHHRLKGRGRGRSGRLHADLHRGERPNHEPDAAEQCGLFGVRLRTGRDRQRAADGAGGEPFGAVHDGRELVAYSKSNPGKLNYSTGGAGTLPHLTAELFKNLSGTQITHVPYNGGGPALADVVAGQVPITFDTVGTSLGFISSGKLRALALVGPKRMWSFPIFRPCLSSAIRRWSPEPGPR